MIYQGPVLRYVGGAMQGEVAFAAYTKPGPIVYSRPTGAAGAVPMVAIVAAVAEDHIVLVLGVMAELAGSVIGGGSTCGHDGYGWIPGGEGAGHRAGWSGVMVRRVFGGLGGGGQVGHGG